MGRNGYPAEFRRKALDLLDAGRAVRDVARDLEISEQSIYTWRGQDRIDKGLVGGLKIPESQHAHSRKSQRDSIIGTIRPRRVRHERYDAMRYSGWVIRSFRDSATRRLWSRQRVKTIDPRIERVALRKLVMLDAAETLNDLRVPPGNRLEALRGDRTGQQSIRINQQWRICFTWTDAGPTDVEIVDYH